MLRCVAGMVRCVTVYAAGTVRRFLENHGECIETVVFAVSDVEEVSGFSRFL